MIQRQWHCWICDDTVCWQHSRDCFWGGHYVWKIKFWGYKAGNFGWVKVKLGVSRDVVGYDPELVPKAAEVGKGVCIKVNCKDGK